MKHLTIREAAPADAGIVFDITQEAFKKYASAIESPQVAALKETKEDILRDMAKKTVLIAYLDGEPAGSVRFQVFDGFAYISRFGVKLMAQGCGVGRALIKEVEKRCRALGLKAILLHSSSRLFSLVRFYYGQGFFIYSTTTDRGYVRALLVKELEEENGLDYGELIE
ncbi:MAG: GNAT family N-acetyltransferase [Bacillota bacterium]